MCTDKLCATKLWGAKRCAAKKLRTENYSKMCTAKSVQINCVQQTSVQQNVFSNNAKRKNCAEHNWAGPGIATFRVRLLLAPASSACLASSVVCCRISRGHPPTSSRSLKPPLKSCNEKSWHKYKALHDIALVWGHQYPMLSYHFLPRLRRLVWSYLTHKWFICPSPGIVIFPKTLSDTGVNLPFRLTT